MMKILTRMKYVYCKEFINNNFKSLLFYLPSGIMTVLILIKAFPSILNILGSCLFLVFICLAIYNKKSIWKKYVFSLLSVIICTYAIISIHMDYHYLTKIVFFLPIIYAFLLKDLYSANIVGLVVIYVFSTYSHELSKEWIVSISIGIISESIAFTIVTYMIKKIIEERNKYYLASITDSLTGLFSLEYILKIGQEMLEYEYEISVFILDLNNFQNINDTYGHLKGNKILIQVAEILMEEVRKFDGITGRLGGDEFIILAKNVSSAKARKITEE